MGGPVIDHRDSRSHERLDCGPARSDSVRVAATAEGASSCKRVSGADLAGAEGHGITSEKKSLHAQEQDTPEGRQRRQNWQEAIRAVAIEDLVFIDESGVTTQMSRAYGRMPRGHRLLGG